MVLENIKQSDPNLDKNIVLSNMQVLACNLYLNIEMSINIKPSKTRKETKRR